MGSVTEWAEEPSSVLQHEREERWAPGPLCFPGDPHTQLALLCTGVGRSGRRAGGSRKTELRTDRRWEGVFENWRGQAALDSSGTVLNRGTG